MTMPPYDQPDPRTTTVELMRRWRYSRSAEIALGAAAQLDTRCLSDKEREHYVYMLQLLTRWNGRGRRAA